MKKWSLNVGVLVLILFVVLLVVLQSRSRARHAQGDQELTAKKRESLPAENASPRQPALIMERPKQVQEPLSGTLASRFKNAPQADAAGTVAPGTNSRDPGTTSREGAVMAWNARTGGLAIAETDETYLAMSAQLQKLRAAQLQFLEEEKEFRRKMQAAEPGERQQIQLNIANNREQFLLEQSELREEIRRRRAELHKKASPSTHTGSSP